jgi:carbon monoxide dehydrogenase subunit G
MADIMPHYTTSVRTPWSAGRALEYLSDLEHFADWDPGVKRSAQVAGMGPGVGSAYDVTVGGVGRDLTLRYVTVAIDPSRRIEVRAETATLLSVDVMTFLDDTAGCVVTYDADLSLKGPLRLANPVLGLVFGRIGDRAAAGLRRALDGAAS